MRTCSTILIFLLILTIPLSAIEQASNILQETVILLWERTPASIIRQDIGTLF